MANNTAITAGTGTTMRDDDVAGVHYPYVKLADGTEDSSTVIASGGGVEAAALRVTVASDSTGVLSVDDNGSSLTIDGSLTAVTTVTTVSAVTAITNALPAGTNAIGKLAANSGVDIGDVDVTSISAGENHLGEVGGRTVVIKTTPTISTGIYAALDNIGGIVTITGAARISGGSGILQSLTIVDEDNEKAAFEIMIFDATPSGGTYTDNATFAHASADIDKMMGRFSVTAADYVTSVAASLATATIRGIGIPFKCSGSANLFAVALVTATPTYTATTDLRWHWGILQD